MNKKIFVTGATGFQGGNIAKVLLDKNYSVSTLKRSEGQGQPANPDIEVIKGGLENKEALVKVLKGVDVAVYTFPLIFDLELAKEYTSNFISAAKEQEVSLIVWNTGFDLPNKNSDLLTMNLKLEIKKIFDESGLKVTTLVPDIYIDNIAAPWSIPVILNNNIVPYPVASGMKVPWISHSDLAKYMAEAVDKPELAGQILPIGGNLLSGEEITSAISKEIGKTLDYVPLTPTAFEEQLIPAFGPLAGKEISNLYRYVESNQSNLIAKDFKRTQEILNVKPQSLTEWVQSVKWQ